VQVAYKETKLLITKTIQKAKKEEVAAWLPSEEEFVVGWRAEAESNVSTR
jgi:hypothetical protein